MIVLSSGVGVPVGMIVSPVDRTRVLLIGDGCAVGRAVEGRLVAVDGTGVSVGVGSAPRVDVGSPPGMVV
jgi:hypothetical protein